MRLIDRTAQTNRWRHHPTAEKLLIAVLAILVALITRSPLVEATILTAMVAVCVFGAAIRPGIILRASIVPLGFILTGLLAQILVLDLSGSFPFIALAGKDAVADAGFLLLRGMAALSGLLFLALTTPLNRIIAYLERIGLNAHIADIALLMFRMVWLLLDCLDSGERALKNRLGHSTYRGLIRSHGLLLAALLPRVLSRARRMENGLAARGYEGRLTFLGAEDRARATPLFAITATYAGILTLGFAA